MNDQSMSGKFAAVAVSILLILTAWGNAKAIFILAAIGLVVIVLISRQDFPRGGASAAIFGSVSSIAIALMMLLLLLFASSACSPSPVPPSPETVSGVYIQSGFEYYRWEEGLALMIWHDGTASSDCATTTGDRGYLESCQATSKENIGFDWELETRDGITGDFNINDESYNLAHGSLFVIRTAGGDIQVQQLQRDLSTLTPDADSVVEFGLNDPIIQAYIQASPIPEDCVTPSTPDPQTSDKAEELLACKALYAFFYHLHAGEYKRAVEYYGGSYEIMRDHNPSLNPDDYATLFKNACTVNGAQCLEIQKATFIGQPSPAEYRFSVQFANEDGSTFSRGSCCGDDRPNQSLQYAFTYTLKLEPTGKYLVLDMPVYSP